ncbi:MAG: prolyl oligopeptidase family serine peptidase [Staphylococcus equorum]
MKKCKLNDLNLSFLKSVNSEVFCVNKDNVDFNFKLSLKPNNNKLLVFSNGALDPSKNTPPVFMRAKWADDFTANCLYIDDRTIHYNGLRIGWGIGTTTRHYLEDYSTIVKEIAHLLVINPEDIIYFGSSAGGFMSIMLATMHKGTTAIVNNPQTYVHKYYRPAVEKMYETIFPTMSEKTILKNYGMRFSVTSMMKSKKNVPKILYIQNASHKPDMESHYEIFNKMLDTNKLSKKNIIFFLYNDPVSGHSAISKEMTVDIVNKWLQKPLM